MDVPYVQLNFVYETLEAMVALRTEKIVDEAYVKASSFTSTVRTKYENYKKNGQKENQSQVSQSGEKDGSINDAPPVVKIERNEIERMARDSSVVFISDDDSAVSHEIPQPPPVSQANHSRPIVSASSVTVVNGSQARSSSSSLPPVETTRSASVSGHIGTDSMTPMAGVPLHSEVQVHAPNQTTPLGEAQIRPQSRSSRPLYLAPSNQSSSNMFQNPQRQNVNQLMAPIPQQQTAIMPAMGSVGIQHVQQYPPQMMVQPMLSSRNPQPLIFNNTSNMVPVVQTVPYHQVHPQHQRLSSSQSMPQQFTAPMMMPSQPVVHPQSNGHRPMMQSNRPMMDRYPNQLPQPQFNGSQMIQAQRLPQSVHQVSRAPPPMANTMPLRCCLLSSLGSDVSLKICEAKRENESVQIKFTHYPQAQSCDVYLDPNLTVQIYDSCNSAPMLVAEYTVSELTQLPANLSLNLDQTGERYFAIGAKCPNGRVFQPGEFAKIP